MSGKSLAPPWASAGGGGGKGDPAPPPLPKLPDVKTGLGNDVDEIVDDSPTLKENLKALEADGWTTTYGEAGKGSFCDKTAKRIVIDPSEKGNPAAVAQTLAHESGHARYTADPYVKPDGLSREEYIRRNANRHLKDEGEATLTNAKVRDEIIANGGPDIGIAGAQAKKYDEIADKYPDPADREKARQEIADAFAKGEHPSTDPTKNYEDYYGKNYAEFWDKHVAKK